MTPHPFATGPHNAVIRDAAPDPQFQSYDTYAPYNSYLPYGPSNPTARAVDAPPHNDVLKRTITDIFPYLVTTATPRPHGVIRDAAPDPQFESYDTYAPYQSYNPYETGVPVIPSARAVDPPEGNGVLRRSLSIMPWVAGVPEGTATPPAHVDERDVVLNAIPRSFVPYSTVTPHTSVVTPRQSLSPTTST